MGIATWKKEFYPPISKVTRANAIDHSLKKWIGLREENLKRHDLKLSNFTVYGTNGNSFCIDETTCSLCRINDSDCYKCEFVTLDGPGTCRSEFLRIGTRTNYPATPEPMIERLEKLKELKAKKTAK